jgi:DNA-binding MarR family transcriptional regulator
MSREARTGTQIKRKATKAELIEELIEEIRARQNATDVMDQAVADYLGINRTDARCLDIVDRHGRITAGQLAAESGLTTGAVTAVLDHLERAGYVRRIRDTNDRRRVLVEPTPALRQLGERLYGEQLGGSSWLQERYSVEQLELLLDFTREDRKLNERGAAAVREMQRRRSARR